MNTSPRTSPQPHLSNQSGRRRSRGTRRRQRDPETDHADDEDDGDESDDWDDDFRASVDERFDRLQKRSEQTDAKIDRLMAFLDRTFSRDRQRQPGLGDLGHPVEHPGESVSGFPTEPSAEDLRRRKVVTKHRSRGDLKLQKAVQKHWATLTEDWAPAAVGMVNSYRLEQGPACTETAFRPDARAGVRSHWNISVTEVFTESFLKSNNPIIPTPMTDDFRSAVNKAATSRLRSWRKMVKVRSMSAAHQALCLKLKRHDERKRNTFLRRLNAAAIHPELHRHVAILRALGPAGMSSDDTDHVDASGVPQYRIKIYLWRHPDLASFLRVFDGVHRHDRFQDSTPERVAGPGGQPHIRNLRDGESIPSTSNPPVGLLSCVYHPELLAKPEGARLRAKPSPAYDFSLHPDMVRLAMCHTGRVGDMVVFPPLA